MDNELNKNPKRSNLIRSILFVVMSTILIYIMPIGSMLGMIVAGFFFARWYYNIGTTIDTTTTTPILNIPSNTISTISDNTKVVVTDSSIKTRQDQTKFDEETEKWLNEK